MNRRSSLTVSAVLLLITLALGMPAASAGQASYEIAGSNNAFAFDLFGQIAADPGNLFLSPYSISSALAMAFAGARCNTESQMAKVMRYDLPQEVLHKAFGQVNAVLNKPSKDYKLSVANALWSQIGLDFVKEYLETVQAGYGPGLKLVDFAGKTEEARLIINKWVEEKTEDKIKELIKPDVLDPLTRLVITNAIYFKGQWEQQFKKELTKDADFTLTNRQKVKVPFMNQQGTFGYAEEAGLQALELTYAGGDLSMLILLPESATDYSSFEKKLGYAMFTGIIGRLRKEAVNVSLPKFKFETELGLGGTLQRMGMTDAFSEYLADFSGISDTFLYITAVIHKAFIEVNEEGSEAAAATAVVMGTKSIGPEPKCFAADRPFFFAIRDLRTGSILFMGRVLDPRA